MIPSHRRRSFSRTSFQAAGSATALPASSTSTAGSTGNSSLPSGGRRSSGNGGAFSTRVCQNTASPVFPLLSVPSASRMLFPVA